MKTFLFYDIETSGLNPAFDQVLTFAAIRTDVRLNEISREEIYVRMRPDIVPSPGAFLTHKLHPEDLENGLSEYDAALQIHQLFNTPDTISCGYNSLGFDDEFLRFLFYRNLLDPYAHQFAKGCSRMDMLPVAAIYRLFCEKALSWPRLSDDRGTLKLEHLARENQFETSGRAHEAMSDVEALVSLARRFSSEKAVWDYVQGFFDRKKDDQRILSLTETLDLGNDIFRIGLMVSTKFGPDANYIAPVLYLGGSEPYKNQSLWLRLDREGLLAEPDSDTGLYDFFAIRKRPGDQMFILPTFDRFWAKVRSELQTLYRENLKRICDRKDEFLLAVARHRRFKYPYIPDLDADASLYQDGFFSPSEKQDILRFHKMADRKDFSEIVQFSSQRIQELARRIVFRNFKGSDSGGEVSHFYRLAGLETDSPITGYKNDTKFTCAEAMAELDEIESGHVDDSSDPEDALLIKWLRRYISQMSASLA